MTDPLEHFVSALAPHAQAGLLAAAIRHLIEEWEEHAVVIRPDSAGGAAALNNVVAELRQLLDGYFPHLQDDEAWRRSYSASSTLHDDAMANPTTDFWQVDLLMRRLASEE